MILVKVETMTGKNIGSNSFVAMPRTDEWVALDESGVPYRVAKVIWSPGQYPIIRVTKEKK